jgi:hypothetical protein
MEGTMHDFSWIELNNIRGLESLTLQKIACTMGIEKFKNKTRVELVIAIMSSQDEKNKFLYYDQVSELFRRNERLNVWKYYQKSGGIL